MIHPSPAHRKCVTRAKLNRFFTEATALREVST
jgi:hypothetical protein